MHFFALVENSALLKGSKSIVEEYWFIILIACANILIIAGKIYFKNVLKDFYLFLVIVGFILCFYARHRKQKESKSEVVEENGFDGVG
jgi:hypothetical protein